MLKRIFALILSVIMVFGIVGCGKKGSDAKTDALPKFEDHEFEISAFYCPNDIGVESLQLYKDAGFNTLALINGNGESTSEGKYYLGSKRTMTALQNAKKVGLYVILTDGTQWTRDAIEGEDYYGKNHFSQHDYYGEYKDIIKGVHIFDEPRKSHFEKYGINDADEIKDFIKTYPNANYIINMVPEYAGATAYEYDTYEEMWEFYGQEIVNKFKNNRFASLDCYYFYRRDDGKRKTGIMKCFDTYAKFAKKYNTSQTFIMQASVSPEEHNGLGEYEGNEFMTSLSEGDIRLQANMAIAFGADAMQYYCYSVPKSGDIHMYQYCILNRDDTPSPLYDYVKNVNHESQAMASSVLSYDWQEATAVPGQANVMAVGEYYDMSEGKFLDTKHYVDVSGTQNVVISRFTSDKHGEAYMLVNFAEREFDNKVNLQMKDCTKLALYGGKGYTGTPKIVELDENGKCELNLTYGEGVFIVPLS